MFEEVQGKDLRKGNPWLDSSIKSERRRAVCFTVAEINPPQLPNCRRLDEKGEYGHLHSKKCGNYEELHGVDLCKRACALAVSCEPLSVYIVHEIVKTPEKCSVRKREPSLLSLTKEKLDRFLDEKSGACEGGL